VQPLLLEGFAFEECAVQAALRLLQRGANLGKVVVRVGGQEPMVEDHQAPLPGLEQPAAPVSNRTVLETQSLYSGGEERGADLGTLVWLGIDTERGVAALELHDPQRFNTMSWALGDDMTRAVRHLSRLGGIRALTLQAAGSTFCAGGNPYGLSSPLSLAASSWHKLESVQVCYRSRWQV
jgi:hypothetical protein